MKRPLLLTAIVLITLSCQAQSDSLQARYKHQLQLIDSLRSFIRNDLRLNARDNFYTEWDITIDSMYFYLYTSKSDKIDFADSGTARSYFRYFENTKDLLAQEAEYRKMGYQTMTYKTAGMSNAKINLKLLSYPDEAIAFILIHEATHHHISSGKNHLPYTAEEALCDAIANYGSARFARQTSLLKETTVTKQLRIFERTYSYLNKQRARVDSALPNQKPGLFAHCERRIKRLTARGNQFQKDRMVYEVNNAYFIRVEPYALHYFEIKEAVKKPFDIAATLQQVEMMSKKYRRIEQVKNKDN